jgi:hypothetical protein
VAAVGRIAAALDRRTAAAWRLALHNRATVVRAAPTQAIAGTADAESRRLPVRAHHLRSELRSRRKPVISRGKRPISQLHDVAVLTLADA